MAEKMNKRSAIRAENDASRAKLAAALDWSPPPPVVEKTPVETSSQPTLAPTQPVRGSTRAEVTTVAVPKHELAQADEFIAWLKTQTGERTIGSSTLVRVLLRTARRDEATVQALREVLAVDGRRRSQLS